MFGQLSVPAEHYDDDYFVSDWRDDDNSYDIETRRRVEGRNPELIKEVFEAAARARHGLRPGRAHLPPARAGVEADGVDFSPRSVSLAPPEVRDRIVIGSVAEPVCRRRATTSSSAAR